MKPLTYSLIAAAFACGLASAVTTAYTTPVGYITHTIAGNVAADPGGADTFIAPTLVNSATFAGQTTEAPVGPLATFTGSVPTGLDTGYIVEIVEGTSEGWWCTISSSTATTITATSDFPTGIGSNVKMAVRKMPTLSTFLGANAIGLTGSDTIQILDPVSQVVRFAVYAGGIWQDFVTEDDLTNLAIFPGTSIGVRHYAETALTFVSTGEVKTTKTEIDVNPGDNWLGQTLPVGSNLGDMNFAAQILSTDFLILLKADQTSGFYVSVGGAMQDFVSEDPSNGVPISEGAGYVIRRPSGAASAIVIPAPVIAP